MSSTKTNSTMSKMAKVQAMLAGLQKHYASTPSLSFNNQAVSVAAIIAIFQAYLTAAAAVVTDKAQYTSSVKARNTALASTSTMLQSLTAFLRVTFGNEPTVLADFGLTPLVRHPSTVQVKAQAVDLRLKTRGLRHTMGSKQRLEIKASAAEVPGEAPAPGAGVIPALAAKP
jgi:hypothetical protein